MKIARIAQAVAVTFGLLAIVGCEGQGGVEAVKGAPPAGATAGAGAAEAKATSGKTGTGKTAHGNAPLAAPE